MTVMTELLRRLDHLVASVETAVWPIGAPPNAMDTFAKKRGKLVGRPRELAAENVTHPREAIDCGLQTPAGIAALLNVNHLTLWHAVHAHTLTRGRAHPQARTGGHHG